MSVTYPLPAAHPRSLRLVAEEPAGYEPGWLGAVSALPGLLAGADVAALDAEGLRDGLRSVKKAETALAAIKAKMLRAAETAKVAETDGATDMIAWSKDQLGESGSAAKRGVELGRGLSRLPKTADALAKGELGIEQAEQLARAAKRGSLGMPGEVEDSLLDTAKTLSPEALRDELKRREADADGDRLAKDERIARSRRSLRTWWRDDGMYELHGLYDPVNGEYVETMLRAFEVPDPAGTPEELKRSPEQRRADALAQAAQVALDAGQAPEAGGVKPHVSVVVDLDTLTCDADIHSQISADCRCVTPAEAAWAGPISREALQRLVCDATLSRVVIRGGSELIDLGTATRKWSAAQRRGIVAIDGGCRFPGCDRPAAWTQIHHIQFCEHDGPTNVDNGVLLCLHHHQYVHEHRWQLTMDPTTRVVTVISPDRRHRLTSTPRGVATRTGKRRRQPA